MKKFLFVSLMALLTVGATAQSAKYASAMKPLVASLDSAWNYDALIASANAFQRIADAEKTQWLPFYYVAYCNVAAAYTLMANPDASKTDPMADKAEVLLNKADELSKDNSEIYIVKKQIASIRMMADPMNRYMTFGVAAGEALEKAKQLNPENPRVYLLEGQDKFYTPEQYGGSKEEAKKLFELSKAKFDATKPETELHPRWGKNQIAYFMSQY